MIISEEQAKLAARDARSHGAISSDPQHSDVPQELIELATAAAKSAPDIRPQRIEDARERMGAGALDSRDVATKMLSRIVSDSLR
jgi:hypothetical protein